MKSRKAFIVCLGFELWATGDESWKEQTIPVSNEGPHQNTWELIKIADDLGRTGQCARLLLWQSEFESCCGLGKVLFILKSYLKRTKMNNKDAGMVHLKNAIDWIRTAEATPPPAVPQPN